MNIQYKKLGAGSPVVLLIHGFCENKEIWDSLAQKLSRKYTVVMPDLPGFGLSPLPKTPFTIEDVGSILVEWVRSENLQNSIVIGHSLGGYVALSMVDLQPAFFKGMGLFHSTTFADSEEKKLNRKKVIEFVKRNGTRPFVESLIPGLFHQKDSAHLPRTLEIAYQTSPETIISYTIAMRDRPDKTDVIKGFDKPVFILAGKHDTAIKIEDSREQARIPKYPVFQELTNAAHMGMFEQETESLEAIEGFVEQCF